MRAPAAWLASKAYLCALAALFYKCMEAAGKLSGASVERVLRQRYAHVMLI